MNQNSISLTISICFILLISTVVIFYVSNKNLIKFNKIILEGNNHITTDLFFELINYDIDSVEFYNQDEIDFCLSKIDQIKNYDIVKNISFSYSLPDKIIVNINEKKPIYIINNQIGDFAMDSQGQIFSTSFLNDDIHRIDLDFSVYEIYKDINNSNQLKDLFTNINNNKLNNNYLLNALDVLNWFNTIQFSNNIKSLSILEHEININLEKTKITFEHQDLENQFSKLEKIINSQTFFDTLNIVQISDLSEINLSFNNQIILKK